MGHGAGRNTKRKKRKKRKSTPTRKLCTTRPRRRSRRPTKKEKHCKKKSSPCKRNSKRWKRRLVNPVKKPRPRPWVKNKRKNGSRQGWPKWRRTRHKKPRKRKKRKKTKAPLNAKMAQWCLTASIAPMLGP